MTDFHSGSRQPCRFCGATSFKKICSPPPTAQGKFDVVQCLTCHLLVTDPLPSQAVLTEQYGEKYFQSTTPFEGGYEDYARDEAAIKKTFQRRWKVIQKFIPPSSSNHVLDVGCATGVFLEVMRENGWNGFGVDVSSFAAKVSKEKGFNVYQGFLNDAPFSKKAFSLLSLWDVIEHVENPLPFLQSCFDFLSPGGVLVLSTPDAGAPFARLTGKRWLGFRSVGEHVFFFDRPRIKAFLEKAGFEVEFISPVGKYLYLDRLISRLSFYTRIFRPFIFLKNIFPKNFSIYVNSGDTMFVIARKKG